MPDICMCVNFECLLKSICYRYLARPSEYAQSYSKFEPYKSKEPDGIMEWDCDAWWEARGRKDIRDVNDADKEAKVFEKKMGEH